jgi:hypothetical protein
MKGAPPVRKVHAVLRLTRRRALQRREPVILRCLRAVFGNTDALPQAAPETELCFRIPLERRKAVKQRRLRQVGLAAKLETLPVVELSNSVSRLRGLPKFCDRGARDLLANQGPLEGEGHEKQKQKEPGALERSEVREAAQDRHFGRIGKCQIA